MAGDEAEPQDGHQGDEGAHPDPGKDTAAGGDGQPPAPDRPEQLADSTGDPLADAFGGTSGESADQFYRTWRQTVASGHATSVSGGDFRDLNVGNTTIYSYARSSHQPGPIRAEILDDLAGRYTRVEGYEALLEQLRSRKLIALRGAPGTGRTATALSLLADAAGPAVSRFGPETDLHSLPDTELQEGSGYLLELVPGWNKMGPLAMQADRACQHVADSKCFMVLITPHDLRYQKALEDYVVDCPLPDPRTVLDLAIDHEIARRPDLEQALQDLDVAGLAESGARLPSEVVWLVTLLLSHASGDISSDQLTRMSGDSLSRYVSDWFDPLAAIPASAAADDQVRLATFRIALAVFNQTPFDLVAEAGERLAQQILTAGSPRRQPGRTVFASHRADYVADSRAQLMPGFTRFGQSDAPSTFAEFIDGRMPAAVLRHVWDVHNIRSPLISWLQSFSQDPRPYVWMRAALAIGLLASWDFSYSFHELIDPWAAAQEPRRRLVAAVALDAASSNHDIRPVVLDVLGGWCRKGTRNLRWTAATALGYDLGLLDPDRSLKDLLAIGRWENGSLAPVASWAAARIFARGGIQPVLAALSAWLEDDRRLVRDLALRAILRIAGLKAADLEDPEVSGTGHGQQWRRLGSRGKWPLLIAITEEDPELLDPLADLIWHTSRSAAAQEPSLEVLTSWMRAAEKDRSCLTPLARFLALLGDEESDRQRLLHLIGVLRRNPDEPLPEDIASRLTRAIEANILISDREELQHDERSNAAGASWAAPTPAAPPGNSDRQ